MNYVILTIKNYSTSQKVPLMHEPATILVADGYCFQRVSKEYEGSGVVFRYSDLDDIDLETIKLCDCNSSNTAAKVTVGERIYFTSLIALPRLVKYRNDYYLETSTNNYQLTDWCSLRSIMID
jgi:hypothetical protein